MDQQYDIHKAAGIIIRDRRLLVGRSAGKTVFVSPGGKIEPGETPARALVRELQEELTLSVREADLQEFGTFYAEAAGSHNQGKHLRMDIFVVTAYRGDITPDNEIEELRWINSSDDTGDVGSIFAHEVLPRLKAQDLID